MLIYSNVNLFIIFLLALIAIVGDYIVAHLKLHVFQAFFDNATHAIIGAISWLFISLNNRTGNSTVHNLVEIALCAAIASLIDLDHFYAAGSLTLREATNLKTRPPLHCSTLPLLLCIILYYVSYKYHLPSLKTSTLIIFTAFVSHHTRDATRRGYWFHPFGSTPPLPYLLYVGITCLIPYFVCFLYSFNGRISEQNYKAMTV